MDFEKARINSIKKMSVIIKEDIIIVGCYFHFVKNI